jgi:syntaxin 16
LQKEQQKRLVIKFDDEENNKLNQNISRILNEITQKLKEAEKSIKDFTKENDNNDNTNNMIKLNMQQTLIKKISDFTKKFKINQEMHNKKYKDLVGEDDPTFQINTSSKQNNNEVNNTIDNFLMTEEKDSVLMRRDTQLNDLLDSVNDLAQIFKDMQSLVMEQGSILDRIDYNIDIAATNVTSGKNSIIKANEYHKNNCFRNVIIVVLVVIFIEALLLIFKFIKKKYYKKRKLALCKSHKKLLFFNI